MSAFARDRAGRVAYFLKGREDSVVSIRQTSKKYRGKKAATYEAVRKKQLRWKIENQTVEDMLQKENPSKVLDMPVGTGRFFSVYEKCGIACVGVDVSEEMLALAGRRIKKMHASHPPVRVMIGDACNLPAKDREYPGVVCVRFLDLIDEDAMRKVVKELCRVALNFVILTIRLGSEYVPKSNTSEHDEKKFRTLIRAQGFEIVEDVPVFKAGWRIMRLRRKK
jgi:Methyltransferase domain